MKIKVLYNYILHILVIREVLPSDIIRSKPVKECNEEMVKLSCSKAIYRNPLNKLNIQFFDSL